MLCIVVNVIILYLHTYILYYVNVKLMLKFSCKPFADVNISKKSIINEPQGCNVIDYLIMENMNRYKLTFFSNYSVDTFFSYSFS